MRIEVVQSGGVAGLQRPPLEVDTASMPPEEARRWEALVAAADFFGLPPTSPPGPRPDAFSYRITVEEGGRRHAVEARPGAASPAVDALIEELRRAARPA